MLKIIKSKVKELLSFLKQSHVYSPLGLIFGSFFIVLIFGGFFLALIFSIGVLVGSVSTYIFESGRDC